MYHLNEVDFEFIIILGISLILLWITFLRVYCTVEDIGFFSTEIGDAKKASAIAIIVVFSSVPILIKVGAIRVESFYQETRSLFLFALWESVAAFVLSFIRSRPYIALLIQTS